MSQKGCFYCKCSCEFMIAHARVCKGVPFVDLFSAFFRVLKRKQLFWTMYFLNLYSFALFVLLKSTQSQFKTIQPQLKVKGKRRKKHTGEPKRLFLLQMFMSIYTCKCRGLQGGTLCGPVFCMFFKNGCKKKTDVLKKWFFWDVSKFALCAFEKYSITIQKKTNQPLFKKGKQLFWRM